MAKIGIDRKWRAIGLAPSLLVFAGLTLLPIANLVAMSFHDIAWADGISRWTFVGFRHYQALPEDMLLRAGLGNTIFFAVVSTLTQMLLAFVLALFVSRIHRGRVLYRTLFILPILVPAIVIGAIWKLMLNYDFGLVNDFIGLFGAAPRDWLGERALALWSVIVVDVWHWTPFCFLLLLAGFESLPQDVYEAARVDGVGPLSELRYITLPLMLPTIAVTLGFRLILAFKVFDEIYLLTGGGPGTATEVLSFTVYRRFFTQDRAGYGAAMSLFAMTLVAVLAITAMTAARRRQTRS
ncbi:MAG: sugar ABC transporter permease [Alphaproteobacteria bacterium]|nr:sugar ABC transporter permease [Alphaproteobacteria bacterium]